MNVLDLFSGIGGASLGLHWAGMRTVAFCEQDPFCTAILHRHWPGVPVYPDIRRLTASTLLADGIPPPDLIVGGFPCQDISLAGHGAGLEGARSGLWTHMARLVAECRPRWVVAENVPGLRSRGADQVCAGLESQDYTVWPLVVGAVHAGAPHRRQRVWIVARHNAPDAPGPRLETRQPQPAPPPPRLRPERRRGWPPEPGHRRVDHGLPARVDRIKALGNAIVPANMAMLARAILASSAFSACQSGAE